MTSPTIALIAPGDMGAPIGQRFTAAGLTVLTCLDGRSSTTRSRAAAAGLQDASLSDIASRADWVLSVLHPYQAYQFAEQFRDIHSAAAREHPLVFVDCNAVHPETAKKIADLFKGTSIKFIDATISGLPPREDYSPDIHACVAPGDEHVLDEFTAFSKCGLKIEPIKGEGANIGDACAVKLAWAVIGNFPLNLSQYSSAIPRR